MHIESTPQINPTAPKTVLTGVKPTGAIHIGNYIGAIRPALNMAQKEEDSLFFIANYHALTTVENAQELKNSTYHVAAAWLACGLDPQKTILYRQSDIPEIFEIAWVLSCYCSKGLMNRAHAYKAKVQSNEAESRTDLDYGVNMGLFQYPILMSSDILSFDTDYVPVGEDQVQHLEIARDLAQKINHTYKKNVLKIPQAVIQKESKIIPGLDGQKMSKSYDNTIPLFADSKTLRKLVMKIKTDSLPPEAPKETEGSVIFQLYKEFATSQEIQSLTDKYKTGLGWGEAKQTLFEAMDRTLTPLRERYESLIQNPQALEKTLQEGAQRARARAQKVLQRVKDATGT